ncbi:endonuclease/exonuclease/phosphatase family protein [Vibrio penaeicida]|uniref:endonuclease/exonuclease/phosphatase family protein n=1 Tax=Vibrio penaeicida TaxID=104609 RepID=UPI001CC559F3|nr:endonuclease/exonuclease/phosphatase family protein [Vibrio penaeicida]
MNRLLPIMACVFSWHLNAATIATINTEWLWDHVSPHEGRVVGTEDGNRPPPTEVEYRSELKLIAKKITDLDADIVSLLEIEGEHIAKDLTSLLPEYQYVFKKSRDTFTSQDIAILTKYRVMEGTVSTNPKTYAISTETKKQVRPSKVLAVGLMDGDDSYYVVATHLISKRHNSKKKDAKRVAQAEAIRKAVTKNQPKYDRVIVMGDMNDTPESATLASLMGSNDSAPNLVQWASAEDYSYVYRGKQQLIDHVLVDSGVTNADFYNVDMPGEVSDHRISVLSFD